MAHLLQSTPLDMSSPEGRTLSTPTVAIVASLLEEGFDVSLRVSGWSMKPLVRSGSILRFSRRGEPSVGDVVLARLADETLVAHRVVALDEDCVWTKGDACRTADGPLSRQSVLGRAVRLEGALSLPLSSAWMRALGLAVNRYYPRLVAAYRKLVSRCARGETAA